MSDSARLVDELTTLLYEPLKGTCLTHPPCVIVACGACHQKADKPESVVHQNDCPVYRLQRAEAANTAVIRANAEEIADLEDVRDALEAKVNALTADVERLTLDSCVDCGSFVLICDHAAKTLLDPERSFHAGQIEEMTAERAALAAQVAALREALGLAIAGLTNLSELRILTGQYRTEANELVERLSAALAAAGEGE